ncbi:uncharacterized protein LAESUDRAFT_760875 [Laetiporus sulphureus 93-53]|uniref:Uncharacterized protein n=1 Tax=Laetiporus sulphureus 93-53 TaxID=1314785 RepID=A0A165DCN4_9APHY|nr:uncharacterized protein LAESUDRAFT_760875 [Laetiporus sulphureus 93-53]KZT04567.1 hypothetical protein LAESUDRAFT_760875 [Laetiporus sulphureus 93-53]
MADLATTSSLYELKSLYPSHVAFSISGQPEAVPLIYKYALNELKQEQDMELPQGALEQCIRLMDRLREALLQSTLLCGASRVIESYYVLSKVIPESLHSKHVQRDTTKSLNYYHEMGENNVHFMYHERADALNRLEKIYADVSWWVHSISYGITYTGTNLLKLMETNFVTAAVIVPMDAPQQLGWQLANARNMGAMLEEV